MANRVLRFGFISLLVTVLVTATGLAHKNKEEHGVWCKVIVSNPKWNIPDRKSNERSSSDLSLYIINSTDKPLLFSRFDTIYPILKSVSGKGYRLEARRRATRHPSLADYRLLMPGESTSFSVEVYLYWQQDELIFGGGDGFGGIWLFRGLKAGVYELAIEYVYSRDEDVKIQGDKGTSLIISKDKVWKGRVSSAFLKVQLVGWGGSVSKLE